MQTVAITREVWDYINLDTLQDKLPTLADPPEHTYRDVANTTEDEEEEFRHLQQRFKRDWEIYITVRGFFLETHRPFLKNPN